MSSASSAYADASWLNTPSYGPSLRSPTFVKEQGLARDPPSSSPHGPGGGAKGLEVRDWYEQFAKAGEEPAKETLAGVEGLHIGMADPPIATSNEAPPPPPARPLPPPPVPALTRPRPPTTSTAGKHKSHRAANPHWFISHSLLPSTDGDGPVPFSLSAPPSTTPSASNLASLLTLPDPGQGSKFQPPPHFHLKPGNKGYDLLSRAGWGGRGLGRGSAVAGVAHEGGQEKVKPKGKGKGKERERDDEEIVEIDREGNELPERKKKRKRPQKLDRDGAIDLTVSSASSSGGSYSDDDSGGESDTSSLTSSTPNINLSTRSIPLPSASSSASDVDGRFHLLAPLPTTLKPDRLGIRSAESMARYRAVTHTNKEIRDAARAGAEEEGRWSAKEIRKRAERERRERVELMGELKRD